jgi:hypothetical protein
LELFFSFLSSSFSLFFPSAAPLSVYFLSFPVPYQRGNGYPDKPRNLLHISGGYLPFSPHPEPGTRKTVSAELAMLHIKSSLYKIEHI